MKPITLRGIPGDIERMIKREAEEFTKNVTFQRMVDEDLWKRTKS